MKTVDQGTSTKRKIHNSFAPTHNPHVRIDNRQVIIVNQRLLTHNWRLQIDNRRQLTHNLRLLILNSLQRIEDSDGFVSAILLYHYELVSATRGAAPTLQLYGLGLEYLMDQTEEAQVESTHQDDRRGRSFGGAVEL